jgi:hypothetical protein
MRRMRTPLVLPVAGATLKPELPRSYRPSAISGTAGLLVAIKTGPKNSGGVRSERPPLHSKVSLCACTCAEAARVRALPQEVAF